MTGQPSAIISSNHKGGGDQARPEETSSDMNIDERPFGAQRSRVDQRESWDRTDEKKNHRGADEGFPLTPTADKPEQD